MGSTHSHPASSCMDALPHEVVERIASFLLSVELVQYARACPALYQTLSSSQVWTGRVAPKLLNALDENQGNYPAWCCREKLVFLRQRALRFGGSSTRASWIERLKRLRRPNGDFVAFPPLLMHGLHHFSLELTFCVRADDGASRGGVLVGFQTTPCEANTTPSEFFTLVSVDSTGGLHLVGEQAKPSTTVAMTVTMDQWHHVVLSYDGRYLRGYLNGELRYVKWMPRGFPWATLPYGQLGTGFGYDANRTLATFDDRRVAWRPFKGLVAHACVWILALDESNVRTLASGHWLANRRSEEILTAFSLAEQTHSVPRVLASSLLELFVDVVQDRIPRCRDASQITDIDISINCRS